MVRALGQRPFTSIPGSPRGESSGLKVALFGDSISNQNDQSSLASTYTMTKENEGYFTWANALLGQPFQYPVTGDGTNLTVANYGVSGNTTTQMLARISDVLNYRPDICIVPAGTNDLTASGVTPLNTITGNLNTIYNTLTSAGILVVAIPILPRGAWGALSAGEITVARRRRHSVNNFVREWGRRNSNPLYRVCDANIYLTDTASATGDPLSTMMRSDLIHPNPVGAYWMGVALRDCLSDYSRFAIVNSFSQDDAFDATDNPRGNLCVNPLLTGTSGTAGTGVSGSVATSWSAQRGSGTGSTCVASKLATNARGLPGIAQRLVITWDGAGSAEERFDFRLTSNITSGFSVGDVLEAGGEFSVTSMSGRHMGIACQLELTATTNQNAHDLDRRDTSNLMPNVNHSGAFRTPPLTLTAGASALNIRFVNRYLNTLAGAVTIDISNVWIRKVVA